MMSDYILRVFKVWSLVLLYIDNHTPNFVKNNISSVRKHKSPKNTQELTPVCRKLTDAVYYAQKLVEKFVYSNYDYYTFFRLSNIVKYNAGIMEGNTETDTSAIEKYVDFFDLKQCDNDNTKYCELDLMFIDINEMMNTFYKKKTKIFEIEYKRVYGRETNQP